MCAAVQWTIRAWPWQTLEWTLESAQERKNTNSEKNNGTFSEKYIILRKVKVMASPRYVQEKSFEKSLSETESWVKIDEKFSLSGNQRERL